jgi:predicted murein hydrolase (TIGR00659 family)
MINDLYAVFWPAFWAVMTIGFYCLSRAIHRCHCRWWTSPLLLTWVLCFILALILQTNYRDYIRGTYWLLTMLGPATVAFAIPIYEQRQLIRKYWPVLLVGVLVGSTVAFGSSWLLAWALGLSSDVRLSLMPRSVTTPFALEFVKDVGGVPELAATCVVMTGLLGASLGETLLNWLPVRSELARGALFGMGAHAVGTARARQMGNIEGSVAGLTMILAGIVSVLVAPIFAMYLH